MQPSNENDHIKNNPAIDQSLLLLSIKKLLEGIRETIIAQPKTILPQKSIQLLPNRPEKYYKIIFSGLFKGMVILIVGIYALVIINRYIRGTGYLHYKEAWQYLYIHQKEDDRQSLDKVWKLSVK